MYPGPAERKREKKDTWRNVSIGARRKMTNRRIRRERHVRALPSPFLSML